MKLRKGDEILVTAGKDKGKRGKIEKVFPKEDSVLILGINVFKRHTKKTDRGPAGIVDMPKPVPLASVALICPKCKKPTRVGYSVAKNEKHRICKKCQQMIN